MSYTNAKSAVSIEPVTLIQISHKLNWICLKREKNYIENFCLNTTYKITKIKAGYCSLTKSNDKKLTKMQWLLSTKTMKD